MKKLFQMRSMDIKIAQAVQRDGQRKQEELQL